MYAKGKGLNGFGCETKTDVINEGIFERNIFKFGKKMYYLQRKNVIFKNRNTV